MIVPGQFIYTCDDVLHMLDGLLENKEGAWWDEFFAEGSPPRPFFTRRPDESLAEWFGSGLLAPGRVLELGCGQGRNAVYLAGLGCSVDAVDFSSEAIAQARERAEQAGRQVNFRCCSIFDVEIADGTYDLVYDSGCFHHLPPHRRKTYVELVNRALKTGGSYGLTCFRPEAAAALAISRCMREPASAAGWATQKIACAPCGASPHSRCVCLGRCTGQMIRNPASGRTSCGRCWPLKTMCGDYLPRCCAVP
jgi:SAM-dependent methyltransferase